MYKIFANLIERGTSPWAAYEIVAQLFPDRIIDLQVIKESALRLTSIAAGTIDTDITVH